MSRGRGLNESLLMSTSSLFHFQLCFPAQTAAAATPTSRTAAPTTGVPVTFSKPATKILLKSSRSSRIVFASTRTRHSQHSRSRAESSSSERCSKRTNPRIPHVGNFMHSTRGSMKRAFKLRAYSYLQIPQFRPKIGDTPPKRLLVEKPQLLASEQGLQSRRSRLGGSNSGGSSYSDRGI